MANNFLKSIVDPPPPPPIIKQQRVTGNNIHQKTVLWHWMNKRYLGLHLHQQQAALHWAVQCWCCCYHQCLQWLEVLKKQNKQFEIHAYLNWPSSWKGMCAILNKGEKQSHILFPMLLMVNLKTQPIVIQFLPVDNMQAICEFCQFMEKLQINEIKLFIFISAITASGAFAGSIFILFN